MRFNRIISLGLALLWLFVAGVQLGAQAIYTPYPVPYGADASELEAPEGYKVVYVSHFGRHGSRYLLKKYAKAGYENCRNNVSDSLWLAVKTVYNLHSGKKGHLSALGAREQEGIGRRMAERFPSLFAAGRIRARTSMANRCRESLVSFLMGVESVSPGLKTKISSNLLIYSRYSRGVRNNEPALLKDLRRSLWHYASVPQLIDLDKDFISRYLAADEWQAMEAGGEAFYYGKLLPKSLKEAKISRPVLREIVSDADAALSGKRQYTADLRFGHDSALVPLCSLIGIQGFCPWEGQTLPVGSLVPMAANIQLVFYRNDAGNVIVKILHNESETSIPSLTPIEYKNSGQFYNWSELRSYLLRR